MSKFLELSLAVAVIFALSGGVARAQDAEAGETLFAKCKSCHAVGEGARNKVGPHLNELIGRIAGTAEGYKYSSAMVAAGAEGLVWTEETLHPFLAAPKEIVPGTKMAFGGLKSEEERANMIAYLATFSTGGSEGGAAAVPTDQAPAPAPEATAQVAPADAPAEGAPAEDAPAQTAAAAPLQQVPETGQGMVLALGRMASPDEVAAWDIDIRPDGLGLPEGSGTVLEGEAVYSENCAACHGDFGEGAGRWPVLAGGQDSLENDRPEKTIGSYWPYLSTVYDYVRRAMPFGNARSLSDDEVYALTAYLMYLNDIVTDEEFELSSGNFGSVRLPNENNFIEDDREAEAHNVKGREPCMSDCIPGEPTIKMHAAVLDVTPEDSSDEEGGAAAIE